MFRTACVLSVVLAISAGAFADYSSEVLKLNPDAYWRMNEVDPTPGATLVNYGTVGEAGDGSWGFTDQPDSMPIAVVDESANTAFPGLGANNQMAQFINNDPDTTAYHQFNLGPASYMNNENQTYSFIYRHDGDASTDGERLIINNQGMDNDFRIILSGYRLVVATGTTSSINDTAATSANGPYLNNNWHHVTVVRNGDLAWQAKVFIDGVEYPLDTAPDYFSKYSGGDANIGARFPYDNGWGNYTGFVDEVATWGRSLTSEEVTSLYTAAITPAAPAFLEGDCNKDLFIDGGDLATLGLNWSPGGTGKTWEEGDFNGDGAVDGGDLAALGLNWAPGGYNIPEPATMVLLSIGGLALIRRRK